MAGPTLGLQHSLGGNPGQGLHPCPAGVPLPGVVDLGGLLGGCELLAGSALELHYLPGGVPGQVLRLCSEEGALP